MTTTTIAPSSTHERAGGFELEVDGRPALDAVGRH
jgi:hypothetical protein